MAALLARLQHINATVIVLPASLGSAATELQSVEATLDAVLYNGTTNATALAAEINAATQNITVTPFPPSTLTALNNSQVQLSSFSDPNAAGGVNTYLGGLSSATASASGK
ncbi:hypothetical protein CVIRNUC_009675 [Coccomyxa viridis]|uniref:Uncharacterized protein n=1 Tax=Coccomyxa viridis TaxID=1274662 RepID=A0AAV1IJT5_9CHLO|nr:hypothetical protein CVIRNUC_009675 [Coccomyxa viridis]